jgi:hypothetical protein
VKLVVSKRERPTKAACWARLRKRARPQGKGGAVYCCDMGSFDVAGAALASRLTKVDIGVEGMPLFRGAIG